VTERLGVQKYVRYVDDFVMIDEDSDRLKSLIVPIDVFLKEKLDLRIHRGKICLQETLKGIDFLGYFIKPTHILVRQKVVKRLKNKLEVIKREIEENPKNRERIAEEALLMVNSYYGHFSHANSYNLRKHCYDKHLGKLKDLLTPDEEYGHINLASETGEVK
jgi:RNA-directed DNA polymerase